MSMDSISLNNNVITATLDDDILVTKEEVTYPMLLAFWEKEAGQAWYAKLEENAQNIQTAMKMSWAAELIYLRPALTRVEQRKQDVIDNEFAVKLSEYMTERGLPYKGGADPTLQEWLENAKVINKYLEEVLLPIDAEFRQETIKAVAEYETALRLANAKGVLFDESAS
ncbi:MAG: hypothetical protein LBF38_10495 [Deltaproteobacteria bacterium]|jgi:hypothetical protein|nr:hypothetical protein [Deltaproteobacteria bacterium]